MPVYPNFYQTLLPCPIVELRGYAAACGLQGKLYAYLDFGGPTGTSRDALAEGMLALAAEKGRLAPGQPVVEASSGAFGMALALAGLTAGSIRYGWPCRRMHRRCGRRPCCAWARSPASPAQSGLAGARAMAQRTAAEKGWYYMNWLANDDNPEYHRRVTRACHPADHRPEGCQPGGCHRHGGGQRRDCDRCGRDDKRLDQQCADRGRGAL